MILTATQHDTTCVLRIDGKPQGTFDTIAEARVELIRCEREMLRRYPGAKVVEQRLGENLTVVITIPAPERVSVIRRAAEAVREERAEVEAEELMLEAS